MILKITILIILMLSSCVNQSNKKDTKEEKMSFYETLTTNSSEAEFAFTSDNTQLFISVIPGIEYEFANANSKEIFEDGDNILLKKIYMILPYQYGGADLVRFNSFRLLWNQPGGAGKIPIPEIGEFGIVRVNPLCIVLEPNIRLQAPDPGDGDFLLLVDNIDVSISQINAPAILQDVDIFLGIGLQIEHTIEMK